MRLPLSLPLTVPATLAACDAVMRMVLWGAGNVGRGFSPPPPSGGRLLIVVPARREGERLQSTLASAIGQHADVLLLLDGDDPGVNAHGARVVVKTPAGPSKAAALAWLAPDFFEHFSWPDDAAAMQTFLRGSTEGVGAAAAESERIGQRIEDLEASLLLTANGDTICMSEAVVLDEKPEAMTAAASQRARWFLGRYELLAPRALVRWMRP